MFETLNHWFQSLDENSKLFDHRDDALLHSALASVLYHVVSADKQVDSAEKHEFARILQVEFELDDEQVEHLYQVARDSTADVHGDLHIVNSYLKHNPNIRLRFMQMLLRLIDIHGAKAGELEMFYQAVHEIFPEVKQLADEAL